MRIVIATYGSTGDIFPLIRLGVALRESSHSVVFATNRAFRGVVEDSGLGYRGLPPHWDRSELSRCMAHIQTFRSPVRQLSELYRAALPCFEEIIEGLDEALDDADCLVFSYLFPLGNAIAERKGIPCVSFSFAHNTIPSGANPPHGVLRLKAAPRWLHQRWNRLAWRIGNAVVDRAINRAIYDVLKRKGLPPVRGFFSQPSELVLVGVSSILMRPEFDLDRRFQFTGYCRWQSPESDENEALLNDFKGESVVPVLTFGSMGYDDAEAWYQRFLDHWPADRKIVVQPGWSGFSTPPSATHILELGPMSHDQLFKHASVVVHHGGAGTTASALFAGKPHIIVPHVGDQSFFAAEVERLGCGLKLSKRRWPERLHSKVQEIEESETYRLRALECRALLEKEDGPGTAVRLIEDHVRGRHLQGDRAAAMASDLALGSRS